MMNQLVIVLNTSGYHQSLRCFAKSLTSHLQWTAPRRSSLRTCRTTHNYSFNIFARRVNKRKYRLLDIQGYIEQDREHFTSQQRFTLADFLGHYQDRRQRGGHETSFHHQHRNIYSYWSEHNILPKDALAKNKITLLDAADTLLAAGASSDT